VKYEPDLKLANAVWPGPAAIKTDDDLFSVEVDINGTKRKLPTHAFAAPIRYIPYDLPGIPLFGQHNASSGVPEGVAELAAVFRPGDIGFAIKHYRSKNRALPGPPFPRVDQQQEVFKLHIKLQDQHVAAVVGVEDYPGIVIAQNPASYSNERFYRQDFPMIFLRPSFPRWVADRQEEFRDNIRTMLVCFNVVTVPPEDFDDDLLGADSVDAVWTFVEKMIRALTGDTVASAFFYQPENLVYCGELIHLAVTAGLHCPLNAETWIPRVGKSTWSAFADAIKRHNSGQATIVKNSCNRDDLLKVQLSVAPDSLKPIAEYAPTKRARASEEMMAFRPMTLFEVIERFVAIHWPRDQFGEDLATTQAEVIRELRPAFKRVSRFDRVSKSKQEKIEALLDDMVETVAIRRSNYEEFRRALRPARERAEKALRSAKLERLFAPPSMFHLIALDKYPHALLRLKYVGHGIHRSLLKASPSSGPMKRPSARGRR